MSLKFALTAALLLAAAPIAAQPPAAPPAPAPAPQPTEQQKAEIQRAGTAYGQCIEAGLKTASATATPEAAAAAVIEGCAPQRAALVQSVDAVIATMPEDKRAAAHAGFESGMSQAQVQIADAIREQRAAPAAPPAPEPH